MAARGTRPDGRRRASGGNSGWVRAMSTAYHGGPPGSPRRTEDRRDHPGGPPAARIQGYDVARALAILGMVVVHFGLVVAGPATKSGWLAALLRFLDGRAAALFVALAGVGLTLR